MRQKSVIKKCPDCGGSGKCQSIIHRLLQNTSSDNPVKAPVLCEALEVTPATLTKIISNIRDKHYPVISGYHGYYVARSADELKQFKSRVLNNIDSLFRTLWAIERHEKMLASGNEPQVPQDSNCQTCSGLGRIMTNTNVYDDHIVGSSSCSGWVSSDA